MAESWPKLIRDPIHNLIRFDDNPCDRLLMELIDCREFQRLRRIKQLGLSDMVFPGATHTRFAHSIGVMCNARRLLAHLRRLRGSRASEHDEVVVPVAALLHDIGHGPLFARVREGDGRQPRAAHRRNHLDPSTDIHRVLSEQDSRLPQQAASLFAEGADLADESVLDGYQCAKYLRDTISSQLDADRWDYLLRDSHFSGTEYGRFDMEWLLEHVEVDEDRLCLTRKAHQAAEGYIFARYHMYQAVYFHKATRASEVMLRLLFARYKRLLDDASDVPGKKNVVPDAPSTVMRAFMDPNNTECFLLLDDHTITEFLKAAAKAGDETIASLADGLLNRRLYKCVDATDASQTNPECLAQFGADVAAALDGVDARVDRDSRFVSDKPSDTPYKIYDPDDDTPATQIYIRRDTGQVVELSRVSEQVDALKGKMSLLRYYFPAELRQTIQPIADKHVRRIA